MKIEIGFIAASSSNNSTSSSSSNSSNSSSSSSSNKRNDQSWKLTSRFFPSKIGGNAAWLDLKNIPNATDIQCQNCNRPCIFLCQIYAPFEDNLLAFHRSIFIFICRDFNCCKNNCNNNLRVLRSQLSRDNNFYPYQPPIETKNCTTRNIDASFYGPTCRICFVKAPSKCSKCKCINYCSKYHQIFDWKARHKMECCNPSNNNNKKTTDGNLYLQFPEYKIIIESEILDQENNNIILAATTTTTTTTTDNEQEKEINEMKKFELMIKNGQAGSLLDVEEDDLMKMTKAFSSLNEDETFFIFQQRIKSYPDQILRYHRGGTPLYISSLNQPKNIPQCTNCNEECQFEFQIMPQLLNYLNFDDVLKSLDWGILAVFTCKNSCAISGYHEEFIWKQDVE